MAEEQELKVVVSMVDEITGRLKSTQDKLKTFGSQIDKAGKVLSAGFAAGIGIAAKEAIKFDKSMGDLSTLIGGDSTQAIGDFEKGIKDMLKVVPVSADELGGTAYSIVSAGIGDTSEALNVLEESAKLGVAGLASTEEAADLMTSAINAFGLEASQANSVSNVLFETVQAGKTTVGELAQSFGQVAPIAASAGVKFEELQAATAALTTSGLQTSVAQTQLKALFTELTKEGTKLSGALKDAGIENATLALESDGLDSVLNTLLTSVDGNTTEFKNLFGSVEASGAAISLTGNQSEAFRTTLDNLRDDVSSVDAGFEKQTKTFDSQLKLLKNEFMPTILDVGSAFLEKVIPVVQRLTQFLKDNEDLIATKVIPTLGAFVIAWGTVKVAMSIRDTILGVHAAFKAVNTLLLGQGGLNATLGANAGQWTLITAAAALTITQIVKAYGEYKNLQAELAKTKQSTENLESSNEKLRAKMQEVTDPAQKERIANIVSENERWAAEAKAVEDRYTGVSGVLNAVIDKVGQVTSKLNEQSTKPFFGIFGSGANTGGLVTKDGIQKFAEGGVVRGTGNKDTVPAMLTPGEVVINPDRGQTYGNTYNFYVKSIEGERSDQVLSKLGVMVRMAS